MFWRFGGEEDPAFATRNERVPCACSQRVYMDTSTGTSRPDDKPAVRGSLLFTGVLKKVLREESWDPVILQEALLTSVVAVGRFEKIKRGIVALVWMKVTLSVAGKMLELDADRVSIIVLPDLELFVAETALKMRKAPLSAEPPVGAATILACDSRPIVHSVGDNTRNVRTLVLLYEFLSRDEPGVNPMDADVTERVRLHNEPEKVKSGREIE